MTNNHKGNRLKYEVGNNIDLKTVKNHGFHGPIVHNDDHFSKFLK
jgi:hypothetical protein